MKLCVNCVHFEDDKASASEFGKCTKIWRTLPWDNPVTGQREGGEFWFAATQRSTSGSCGPSGTLWKSHIPVKEKPVEPKRPNIIYRAANRLLRMFR